MKNTHISARVSVGEPRLLMFAGPETPSEVEKVKLNPTDDGKKVMEEIRNRNIDLKMLNTQSSNNKTQLQIDSRYERPLQTAQAANNKQAEEKLNAGKNRENESAQAYRRQQIKLIEMFKESGFTKSNIDMLNIKTRQAIDALRKQGKEDTELNALLGMVFTLSNDKYNLYENLMSVDPAYYVETGLFFVKEIDPQTGKATSDSQLATPEVMEKVREQQRQNGTRLAEIESAKRMEAAQEAAKRAALVEEKKNWPREFAPFIKLDEQGKRIPVSNADEATRALIAMRGTDLDIFYKLVDPAMLDNGDVMSRVLGKVPKENLATFLDGRSDKLKQDNTFMQAMLDTIKSDYARELLTSYMNALNMPGNRLRADRKLMTQVADLAFEKGKLDLLKTVVTEDMVGLRNDEVFMRHIATIDVRLAVDLASRRLRSLPPKSLDDLVIIAIKQDPSLIENFDKKLRNDPLIIQMTQTSLVDQVDKVPAAEKQTARDALRDIMKSFPDFTYLIEEEDLRTKSMDDLIKLRDMADTLEKECGKRESLYPSDSPMRTQLSDARWKYSNISKLAKEWIGYQEKYAEWKGSSTPSFLGNYEPEDPPTVRAQEAEKARVATAEKEEIERQQREAEKAKKAAEEEAANKGVAGYLNRTLRNAAKGLDQK